MNVTRLLFLATAVAVSGCGRKVAKLNELEGSAAGIIQKLLVFLLVSFAALIGCAKREQQYTVEGQTALKIILILKNHEIDHPDETVTNLAQAFAHLPRDYPHLWHQRLLPFGKHAGFTNSIYEKYIFFPRGITNYVIDGELVFMNAKPYPGPNGQLERNVVSKTKDAYRRRTLKEGQVRRLFSEAQIKEPTMLAMPPPPPAPADLEYREPLSTSIQRFYVRLAESFGIDGGKWWIFRDVTIGFVLIAFLATIGFIWRTRTRRQRVARSM